MDPDSGSNSPDYNDDFGIDVRLPDVPDGILDWLQEQGHREEMRRLIGITAEQENVAHLN